jgi:predicted flavoprotein YhiN
MGATGFAYELARSWGMKIVEPRPALVPLTLAGDDLLFRSLSGVAAPVVAAPPTGPPFREAALFTHRGLSGPAILQVSSYWRNGEDGGIDFVPDAPANWLTMPSAPIRARPVRRLVEQALPARLAETLCDRLGLDGPLGGLRDRALATAEASCAAGASSPMAAKAMPRPRSPSAASRPPNSARRRWRRSASPACS